MKVFISYSGSDLDLVRKVADTIRPHATPLYWDQDKEPGTAAWHSIFQWIDASDCVIALITDAVVKRTEAVHHEIGYAKGKGKTILPMVGTEVDRSRLGCLNGVTYVLFDPNNMADGLSSIRQRVASLAASKKLANELLGIALLVGAVIALCDHS